MHFLPNCVTPPYDSGSLRYPSVHSVRGLAVLLFAFTLCLPILAGCREPSATKRVPGGEAAIKSEFVGDAACAECHPAQAKDHKASGHGLSLRWATVKDLGKDAPPLGRIPGSSFAVEQDAEGRLMFVSTSGPKIRQPLGMAFGAGHGGITFCTVDSPVKFTKLRISYFPVEKMWRVTPGMETRSNQVAGDTVAGDAIIGCVKCHSVTLPPNSAVPENRFMGVGCESCHGPGSAHIEAARTAGARDLRTANLRNQSALEIQHVCSKCHSPINESMFTLGDAGLLRFQPESLLASRCFSESQGKISCLTCHDSHKDLERNPKVYENACFTCHAPKDVAVNTRTMSASVCPVNPRSDCIRCHMPKRQSFHESDIPTMMTDHMIAVHNP